MTRWHRCRAFALAAAIACAVSLAVAGPANVAAADDPLVPTTEWHPFPKDSATLGHVAVDSVARIGYAFSGVATQTWSRLQAIDLDSGKPISNLLQITPMASRAPVLVDERRHLLITVETYNRDSKTPLAGQLVGFALRGRELKQVFRVPSSLGVLRLAGLGFDDKGDDVVAVGTADGMMAAQVAGSSVVRLERVSIDALLRGTSAERWGAPVELPLALCPTLIQSSQSAGVLVTGDRVYLGCRGASVLVSGSYQQTTNGASAGIVEVRGVDKAQPSADDARMYRAQGNFLLAGETFADRRTRRFLLGESSGGAVGLRVFDTDHRRYVGRINAGQQALYGSVIDPRTSRVYFVSVDPSIGIGDSDISALVPTQGERLPSPYAAWLAGGGALAFARQLSFDPRDRRLFVPLVRQQGDGSFLQTVLVMRDVSERYTPPSDVDYSAGVIDAVDKAGVTDSDIAATARAFGADYQIIGGTASIVQNLATDARGTARPGSRYLRQAYVRGASLTGDGAVADATMAEEDGTTDLDRNQAIGQVPPAPSPAPSAGPRAGDFAPGVECGDFAAIRDKHTTTGAEVECDLGGELVNGLATYSGNDGAMITTTNQSVPQAAPIQMGRSVVEVREQRAPGRGALTTTVTAVAENVTILDLVRFGRISQTVTVTAHGRHGTAKVTRPPVTVSDVEVQGKPLCTTSCPLSLVQERVNAATAGRAWIEFPPAQITEAPAGTYAELLQDPWYHAERNLEFDKPTTDYAVPAMTAVAAIDGSNKSRLAVDFAGIAATASYRVFPAGSDDFPTDPPVVDSSTPPVNAPLPRVTQSNRPGAPTVAPSVAPPAASGNIGGSGIIDRIRLSLRSLGEALPLLLVWALLGIPSYLAARRRLLLELPMLTRDEEPT